MNKKIFVTPTDSTLEKLVRKKTLVELHYKYGFVIPFGAVYITNFDDENVFFLCQEDLGSSDKGLLQEIRRYLIESIEILA